MRLLRLWRLMHRDVRLICRALRRADRPRWLLPAVLLLLFFALDPLNLALPTLGILDELIVLPLLLRAVVKLAGQTVSRPGPMADQAARYRSINSAAASPLVQAPWAVEKSSREQASPAKHSRPSTGLASTPRASAWPGSAWL